jgi:hypothetical protein
VKRQEQTLVRHEEDKQLPLMFASESGLRSCGIVCGDRCSAATVWHARRMRARTQANVDKPIRDLPSACGRAEQSIPFGFKNQQTFDNLMNCPRHSEKRV